MTRPSSGQAGASPAMTDADIKRLLEAFRESGFGRLDLECGAIRLSVSHPGHGGQGTGIAIEDAVPVASPSVGFFSDRNSSDGEVGVGRTVTGETALGIVRRVGSEKEMHAGTAGVIVQKLVKDGDFVEYGQTLFQIRPDATGGEGKTRGAAQ